MFAQVFKANPFHDEKGRFATKDKGWVKVGHQKGSNPGGVYDHGGVKHYVKFPHAVGQVKAEEVADKMYELMGVKTLGHKATTVGDQTASANEWQDVQKLGQTGWRNLSPKHRQTAANAFIASALTKNWDVVGMEHDNMGFNKAGDLTIFDTGGSFQYRAQGGPKPYDADPMPDILGMLDVTKTSGRVFGPLMQHHRKDFERAARKLKSIPDRTIKQLADELHVGDTAVARKKAILRYFKV